MLVSDLSVMCKFTQCSTHAIQCSDIPHTQCSTHAIQCSDILHTQCSDIFHTQCSTHAIECSDIIHTQCSTHAIQCSDILHTQCYTHAIQCSAILRNVFHFLLCYDIIHVALLSLSMAIQKTKHLKDCLVNLALYIFLTTFQYNCWELSVYNLSTPNHVYVKRNTALMILLTIGMRFVYNIRKMWCLVKFII